jgi:hypothetical protein
VNFDRILDELRSERSRIDQAIAALEKVSGGAGRGRPARKRRHMSPAARRKISQMMKLRWAERKKKSRAA